VCYNNHRKYKKGGELMTWAETLLNVRAKYRLTQKELAEVLDISKNMVYRYEVGISKPSVVNKVRMENNLREWEMKK
jgi:predicted transcriptional regulator